MGLGTDETALSPVGMVMDLLALRRQSLGLETPKKYVSEDAFLAIT